MRNRLLAMFPKTPLELKMDAFLWRGVLTQLRLCSRRPHSTHQRIAAKLVHECCRRVRMVEFVHVCKKRGMAGMCGCKCVRGLTGLAKTADPIHPTL